MAAKANVPNDFKKPWCAELLASPDILSITMDSQIHSGPTGPHENSFFAKTIATPSTVKACLPLRRSHADPLKAESMILISLGTDLSGHSSLLAGGVICALFDETLGLAASQVFHRTQADTFFTIEINVKYHKPVPTPGLALCKASILKVEGRRMWTIGTLEDGNGVVHATGHATFMRTRRTSL